MTVLHRVLPVALTAGVLLAGALVPAQAEQRALPDTVVVHDSRTSAPAVDISKVTLKASWYWDSEQSVYVTVPSGFRAGHRLDVFFDINGDSVPDGHYDLKLLPPKKKGGTYLRIDDEFRLGGGWTLGGTGARCSTSDGFSPAAGGIRVGERTIALGMDLWSCLQTPNPPGLESGSWRAAARVALGAQADMAPNARRWSEPVAGWEPCDPSGGSCS